MKKVFAIILACCMLISVFAAAANAQTKGSDLAVAAEGDKLDPSVVECLHNPEDDGKYFEIRYHSMTEAELIAQIKSFTYAETEEYDIGAGKALIGLPYTSVVKVASLENVDYITLPDESERVRPASEKIDAALSAQIAQMDPDDKIDMEATFSYPGYPVYIGIDESQCTTQEEIRNYNRVKFNKLSAYYNPKNHEYFARLRQSAFQAGVTLEYGEFSNTNIFYLCLSVKDVETVAAFSEIYDIRLLSVPIEKPTEMSTEASTTRPTTPPTIAPTTPPTEAPTEPKDLYRERLKKYYNIDDYDPENQLNLPFGYQELYYHRDDNCEIDWALIQCYSIAMSPIELTAIVGNRVLHPGNDYYPFDTTYGIYDVKNDKFIDACTSGSTLSEAYNYDGFVRAFDEIVGGGMGWSMADVENQGRGKQLGDIDNNGELDITDVTFIQRCEAMIMEYPASNAFSVTYDFGVTHYYSDFNRDGERDILDATCIQRYLVGMDYPIG